MAGKKKLEEVKRALDSAIDAAQAAPAPNRSTAWAGERPTLVDVKGESRHMMALEG